MKHRKNRKKIALYFGLSLLAAVLVIEAKSTYDLSKERNVVHDANLKLKQQMEQSQSIKEKIQKQYDDLQNENRSLHQEVDALHDQLQQAGKAKLQNQEKLTFISAPAEAEHTNWLSFKATYYDLGVTSCGKRPGDPGYGITASGKQVQSNLTIAVDPRVIPLGSWVEVMYPDGRVEKRRADDTGSAIKGKHVDIYVPKVSSAMGVDEVKLRVISKPKEI